VDAFYRRLCGNHPEVMGTADWFEVKSSFMSVKAINCSGFTLVELMVTVALAAMLITVAVPSFVSLVRDNRMIGQINEVSGSLRYARSEAAQRRVDIVLCPTVNNTNCSGSNWEVGRLAFLDINGDGVQDVSPGSGEDVIRVWPEAGGGLTLRAHNTNAVGTISFDPSGASSVNTSLLLCDSRGINDARAVVLIRSGGIRTASDTEVVSGALSCP
jgi:type IV fimbrial biogenesis protein FimT